MPMQLSSPRPASPTSRWYLLALPLVLALFPLGWLAARLRLRARRGMDLHKLARQLHAQRGLHAEALACAHALRIAKALGEAVDEDALSEAEGIAEEAQRQAEALAAAPRLLTLAQYSLPERPAGSARPTSHGQE